MASGPLSIPTLRRSRHRALEALVPDPRWHWIDGSGQQNASDLADLLIGSGGPGWSCAGRPLTSRRPERSSGQAGPGGVSGSLDLIASLGERLANHAGQARGAAPLGSERDEDSGHRWCLISRLLGVEEASALVLICRSVARRMWATNGRIIHQ